MDHGEDVPSRRKGDLSTKSNQPSEPEPPERRWITRNDLPWVALTISYRAFHPWDAR